MSDSLTETSPGTEDTQSDKYLTFALDREVFGLEIRFVTEIVGLQEISEIPEAPDYVKGIINLRGKVIPVIDMRLRFKKPEAVYSDRTCIVVIDIPGLTAGLIVDNVNEVVTIPDSSIVPPPSFKAGFHSRYINGIGKCGEEIRLLLNCEKLFMEEEINDLRKIDQMENEKPAQ